ncbi:MAG TPA: ATP-binding protein [Terriglobales bacterium]|nr:ATP-binding protein [Terriglobales bacterium]
MPDWSKLRKKLQIPIQAIVVAALAAAATVVLALSGADRDFELMFCLPGIAVAEALFGLWAGIEAVLVSVAANVLYRAWWMRPPGGGVSYAPSESELLLLAVGMFVVALMEMRRRSGLREASGMEKLAALLENLTEAAIIFDQDDRVVSLNPAARALFGRSGPALIGVSGESIRRRWVFSDLDQDSAASPAPGQHEGTLYDVERDQSLHVLISTAPWHDPVRHTLGRLVLLSDITELRELQSKAVERARHLAVAQMAAALTHDFNQVLDIIRRAVEVLTSKLDAPAEERRKFLGIVDQAVVNGAAMVRRLRVYLADGEGERQPVDLSSLAREAVELTRPVWRSRPEINFQSQIQPQPRERWVLADAGELRRVLVNLIFNALEAMPPRGGRITVAAFANDHSACVYVEDTGTGIPPGVRDQIFQPYFTTKSRGMGLGLFAALKIASAHGGTLSFAPREGGGTRFTLELPLAAQLKAA